MYQEVQILYIRVCVHNIHYSFHNMFTKKYINNGY